MRAWIVGLLLAAGLAPGVEAAPKIMVSIVPLHALVAEVMQGVAVPTLLLQGQNSEHQASFGPAQITAMAAADKVFFIGSGLEVKLAELSGSEAVNGRQFMALGDAPGVVHLPLREGGAWVGHDHDDHDDHDAAAGPSGMAGHDPHVWLDPENARAMVRAIALALADIDRDHAATYLDNAKSADDQLVQLSRDIAATLAPVKGKPFVVFHDAYQYFEARYGLAGVGSIADFAATPPSAKRLSEVRAQVVATGAKCIFHEPQFSDRAAQVVAEGSGAQSGVLDPLGATLEPGPNAYAELMGMMARNLRDCLAAP